MVNGCMYVWIYGWIDGRTDKWLDGRVDGIAFGRMDAGYE